TVRGALNVAGRLWRIACVRGESWHEAKYLRPFATSLRVNGRGGLRPHGFGVNCRVAVSIRDLPAIGWHTSSGGIDVSDQSSRALYERSGATEACRTPRRKCGAMRLVLRDVCQRRSREADGISRLEAGANAGVRRLMRHREVLAVAADSPHSASFRSLPSGASSQTVARRRRRFGSERCCGEAAGLLPPRHHGGANSSAGSEQKARAGEGRHFHSARLLRYEELAASRACRRSSQRPRGGLAASATESVR